MKEFFQLLGLASFLLMAAVVIFANLGWSGGLLLLGILIAPFLVFTLLPYLLGSRPGWKGCSPKGYYYSYNYKYGAKF